MFKEDDNCYMSGAGASECEVCWWGFTWNDNNKCVYKLLGKLITGGFWGFVLLGNFLVL